eukprot:2903004-Rhodomonas_salina.1
MRASVLASVFLCMPALTRALLLPANLAHTPRQTPSQVPTPAFPSHSLHRAVTAPFPAPIKDVREGAAIKAKEGAAKGRDSSAPVLVLRRVHEAGVEGVRRGKHPVFCCRHAVSPSRRHAVS